MKFLSASRKRIQPLTFSLRLERLEDRVQPGSVMPWPAWSDLDASLSDLERDTRRLRDETAHAAQFRLLEQTTDQPFGVPVAPAPNELGSSQALSTSAEPTPNLTQPAADLARVVATRGAATVTPTPTPVVRTGTPITAASVRTGAMQSSGLTLQLQPATAESIDLQASPEWFSRPVEFKIVQHMNREEEGGIQALLDWSTYLTGTGETALARSVAVDVYGNSYVTGWFESEGDKTGYVIKYDPTGVPFYATVFQAQDNVFQYRSTEPGGIAVDGEGNAYVGGTALRNAGTITDGFALKLDPDGANVVYGYSHGLLARPTTGTGIAVDALGRAYVTGNNLPAGYAFPHVFIGRYKANPTLPTPMDYAYAHAIRSEDPPIEFRTSTGNGIAVDPNGSFIYVGGETIYAEDKDFFGYKVQGSTGRYCGPPLCYVFTTPPNLGDDYFASVAVNALGETFYSGTLAINGKTPYGFVGKVDFTGSDSPWSIIFEDTDHAYGIAYDGENIYASGSVNDAATLDAFVVKLDPTGSDLDGFIIEGDGDDIGYAVAYYPDTGTAFVAGSTTSTNVSTDGTLLYGFQDGFLTSIGTWF